MESLTLNSPVTRTQHFAQVCEAFEHAVLASADIRRYYRIGPDILCLRFAGNAPVPMLTAALAHKEIPAAEPSLTILCCDDASIRLTLLEYPNKPIADDDIQVLFTANIPSLNLFSRSGNLGIYWVKDIKKLPLWESSLPFRHLLHWWYRDSPRQIAHAGAVGTPKGGVLLTGKGVGKSTTALACLNSSLDYVGDDYVLVSSEPEPYVYNLYNTAKLVPDNLGMFPHLADKVSNAGALAHEKALFFLHEHYPQKLSAGFPLKAIFLPLVTHERTTRLRPATGAEALLALSFYTLMLHTDDSRLSLDKMSKLVQSLPKYWLEVGTDLDHLPTVIIDFLGEPHD